VTLAFCYRERMLAHHLDSPGPHGDHQRKVNARRRVVYSIIAIAVGLIYISADDRLRSGKAWLILICGVLALLGVKGFDDA
jgi:hypothetical protein